MMTGAIKTAGKEGTCSYLSSSYSVLMSRHINMGTDMILGNNPEAMQSFVDNYYGLSKDFIKSKTIIKTSDGEVLTHPYIKTPEGILKLNPFEWKKYEGAPWCIFNTIVVNCTNELERIYNTIDRYCAKIKDELGL